MTAKPHAIFAATTDAWDGILPQGSGRISAIIQLLPAQWPSSPHSPSMFGLLSPTSADTI